MKLASPRNVLPASCRQCPLPIQARSSFCLGAFHLPARCRQHVDRNGDDQLTRKGRSGNVPPQMRLTLFSWIVLLFTTPALHAQPTGATPLTRQMSLNECIRMALEHNLDIKIGRFSPQIGQLNLDASYGYYDPIFSGRAQQTFNSRPGKLDPNIGVV